MKLSTLLLAGSLVANAALVALFAFQPILAPPAIRDLFARTSSSRLTEADQASARQAAEARAAKAAAASAADAQIWESLQPDDLPGLVARLRAAGFPPSAVRSIVSNMIGARFAARFKQLMSPDDNTPYWKVSSNIFGPNDTKRMEQYRQLSSERSKLQRELLGDDFFNNNGEVTAAQRRQFGDLSRSKIDLIQRIGDDYAEMTSQIRGGMQGVTLPEDREKLALLEREKHADLAAILTPEELADYEMRSSPIMSMMRTRLGAFDPSEAEFRAVYQVQQSISDKFAANGGLMGGDYQLRQTLQQQFTEQMKAALGPERYAEYDRAMNRDYQQLTRLAERENIPATTTLQAFNLRDSVAAESNQIFDNPALDAVQKRAALELLAQNARTQLLATLGPTVGPAYVKIADNWLTNVERGSAVSFSGINMSTMTSNGVTMLSGGSSPTYRRVPAPRPAGAPAAPPAPPPASTGVIIIRP